MARPLYELLGYEVVSTLGKGASSVIMAVKDRKGQLYAMKYVLRDGHYGPRYVQQALHEHKICQQFNHENLRKSYKPMTARKLFRIHEVCVLMEFVDGLTMEQYKPATIRELCEVFRHVCHGLESMHKVGVIHCDIKPNNIMVTEPGQVKIIDFGQSCKTGTIKDRIQGTPDYIAPEQVKRRHITPQTDVFNLGATMYWLLTGRYVPTRIPKKNPAGLSIRTDEEFLPPREINPDVPPALSSLVMQCVQENPTRRPQGMQEVLSRLSMAIAQLRRQG